MRVQYDEMMHAGKTLEDAVKAVAKDAVVTFHNTREASEKPKAAVKS
jgi:hypothetical protein